MKNIFLLLIAFTLVTFTSCEDEEKTRVPFGDPVNPGAMVTLAKNTLVIDVTNISGTSFDITLDAPSNNVESFDITVRKVTANVATEYYPLRTVTSFPSDESISAADIAAALGLDVTDLGAGDRFDFLGTANGTDGSVVTYNDLDADLASEGGQNQGFKFVTYISCPFVATEGVGTYTITDDPFGASLFTTFDIVEGDSAGELVLVDVFGHARFAGIASPGNFDVIGLIDADSGILTVEDYNGEHQYAWDSSVFGLTYGNAWLEGGFGFLFGCSGQLVIDWEHWVALGTYGSRHFEASK